MPNLMGEGLDVSLNIYHLFLVVVGVGEETLFFSLGELPRSNNMLFYTQISQFTSRGTKQSKYKL